MNDLRITLIQQSLFWEDKEKNLSLFEEKIDSISEKTDLIVLPEMFSTGFTMNAAELAEGMDGPTVSRMRKIAQRKNCVITGSFIAEENGMFYNRLIWMRPDGFDYYDKRHLFTYAKENQTYRPGKKKLIVTLNGWRILPLICYDLRFPVWSRRSKKEDYDLLLYIANWPEKRSFAWKQLLIARAIENQSYVVGLNRQGNDGNNIYHSGDSVLLDYTGKQISDPTLNGEFIQTIIIYKEALSDFRKHFAFFEDGDDFELNS